VGATVTAVPLDTELEIVVPDPSVSRGVVMFKGELTFIAPEVPFKGTIDK